MSTEPVVLGELKEASALEALRTEIQMISELALLQRITNTDSKDRALAIGADVKRVRKALDERRKLITGPMQDTVKRIIAFAAQLDAPLERAESHIRREAVAYANEIAEQQKKAQALIELEKIRLKREEEARLRSAAAMAPSLEDQLQAQEQVRHEAREQARDVAAKAQEVKSQGVKGTTEVWTFEVTDPALVPREYLIVDQSLIRQAVHYRKLREIPGVRIYTETRVRLG